MPTLELRAKSPVLSLLPLPKGLAHLEGLEIPWPREIPEVTTCDVLIAPAEALLEQKFRPAWDRLRSRNPGMQLVVILDPRAPIDVMLKAQREYPLFRIFESFDEPEVEWALFAGVEKSNLIRQNFELQNLVQDQNEKLKNIQSELEERVQKRQRYLEESRRKNLIAQFRWQTLRLATETIQGATSVRDMERSLTDVLQESLHLQQVRLLVHSQSSMVKEREDYPGMAAHRVRLFQDQDVFFGYAVFLRDQRWPFSLEEKDFMQKICETMALALRRLHQLDMVRTLREQWQATFNAVSDPIAIIQGNYEILQTNTAFAKRGRAPAHKCYRVLFDRETPCPHCHLGQSFRVENPRLRHEVWDVKSQALSLNPGEEPVYFNQYHDLTSQLKIEKRLREGTKLAELGLIGSSIAHELNNPLGGILSFVQMMKMDMAKDDPLLPDVLEMESGVFRCRDIVQNLLGFTRSANLDERKIFDLREALERALSIFDLQSKALGFEVRHHIPVETMSVFGNPNLLSQAFTNLMQNAVSGLSLNSTKKTPVIEVIATEQDRGYEVTILDNSPVPENPATLSLPLAQQIIHDHDGQIEITTPTKGFRTIKVLIPKPSPTS